MSLPLVTSLAGEMLNVSTLGCVQTTTLNKHWLLDAAKKHHEYLVRLEKTEPLEAKDARLKSARIKQRRIRVSFIAECSLYY